ncbi:MAG: hypothetical protein ACOY46_04520 [Bacillota bacterium]
MAIIRVDDLEIPVEELNVKAMKGIFGGITYNLQQQGAYNLNYSGTQQFRANSLLRIMYEPSIWQ